MDLARSKQRRRAATLIAAPLLLVGLALLARQSDWRGEAQLHTLMELAATVLAIMVGVLALLRFYSKKDNTFLFVGMGYLVGGLFDGYHTIVTSSYFMHSFPAVPPALTAWSWLASNLFLSILLCLSWLFCRRSDTDPGRGFVPERRVYAITALLAIACSALFVLAPLPMAYQPDMLFPRPQEFVPAALLLFTLAGYVARGKWRSETFEYWLLLSIIFSMCGEAMFMAASHSINDASFVAVHVVKIVSYLCALVGLLINIYRLWSALVVAQDEVERLNGVLQQQVAELRSHRDHLEHLVTLRTLELSTAKERAELASRSKSVFLANMSHELRTPLNAVLGYAQMLKRRADLVGWQATAVNTIEQSGEHLLLLIGDLLDMARIEAGRLTLSPTAVPVEQFMTSIADILRVRAEQKGLAFVFEAAIPRAMTVQADEKRWRQILLNLLSNAVKFTEHGQVLFRVSCDNRADTARVRVDINDTGVGMSTKELGALFTPFEQFGSADQRIGGSGLGLAISRQLAVLMHTDITVRSELGIGSCFSCEFHFLRLADSSMQDHSARPMPSGYTGARRTVLVVDDVAANRDMMETLLAPLGFAVLQAADGASALALASASLPDLIIADLVMPGMDGLDMVRQLRQMAPLQQVPVVIMSASTADFDQDRSLAVGANAFLSKPIQIDTLLTQIESLLSLTWVVADRRPVPLEAAQQTWTVPDPSTMAQLLALARDGATGDIERWAERIGQARPECAPFADQLVQLARSYQSRAILQLVERCIAQAGGDA